MYNIVRNQRIHNFVGGSSSELRTNEGRAETEKRKMTKENICDISLCGTSGFHLAALRHDVVFRPQTGRWKMNVGYIAMWYCTTTGNESCTYVDNPHQPLRPHIHL